ncbi:MAG: histidine ammonia-lyase [Erysipelotrichaceae bacterium]|nr:histidine ammonia-lyase [Erysipelotrichaceae bacterium]
MELMIDGHHLVLDDVIDVARNRRRIALSDEAKEKIRKAEQMVKDFVEQGKVSYGITTGFGKFSDTLISKEETGELQRNLIMSHAVGVGDPFSEEIVRAMMLLRINSLSQGFSGIRLSTLETLVNMLNRDVYPLVYEKGSLGASGDLCPLAHMALTLIGEGEAFLNGKKVPSKAAMEAAGIKPVVLSAKEGLSLINGTQAMCAVGCITAYDALQASKLADVSVALSMEALEGIRDAFDARVHAVRPHSGQIHTADNVRDLLDGSERITNQGEKRVQDAYVLRCAPQVHGACKDAIRHVVEKLEIEINSVTDNPILFVEDEYAISGGNFHGESVAMAFDYLGIAISELANIAERRVERLVNPALNNDLPAFLTPKGGLNSGFMIVQYAAAALVSENKVLAHPASVDSIPSSANQEDHVSMGTIAARKAQDILKNTQDVLAMEMLCSTQAIDLQENGKLGKGTQPAYETIRKAVPFFEEDTVFYPFIHQIADMIHDGSLLAAVEHTCTLKEV